MQVTKLFDPKIEVMEGERSVKARISTIAVDREGDVVMPSGLDVSGFAPNPVVLFMHDMKQLPIGRATEITRTPSSVDAMVKFAKRPDAHPDAAEWLPDTIFDLFKQGILRAFSVGFTVPAGGARSATKRDVKRFGDGVQRIIQRWKMHEFSVAPVPMNPEALATAVSKGIIDPQSTVLGDLNHTWRFDVPAPTGPIVPTRITVKGPTRIRI